MNSTHARLHALKMLLASVLLVAFGSLLIALGQLVDESQSARWFSFVPWNELGGIIIGAGLLSIWLDHLFRREQQAMTDLRLRQILNDHAPLMRDAVIEAFAANHGDLVRVATPQMLDQIITNSLALRLDDRRFAQEIWGDVREQVVKAPERRLDISLTSHPEVSGYFAVTVRWEYTTIPAHAVRRFVCLADRKEYAELVAARDGTTAWFKREDPNFAVNSRSTYELLQFSVDGEERPVRRVHRKHYQAYAVDVGVDTIKIEQPVTISYTFRTVTKASGNLLFFDIEQPTRDVSVTLDYTGCNIESISAIDQVPSVRPTRIEHSLPELPKQAIRVEIDGWVFPRAGVAFVWSIGSSQNRTDGLTSSKQPTGIP